MPASFAYHRKTSELLKLLRASEAMSLRVRQVGFSGRGKGFSFHIQKEYCRFY